MKRILSILLLAPILGLAQVTTNPSVTGVPAPQSAVAITGGTINGTSIGATTPAAGAFTTLSATGAQTFSAGASTGTFGPSGIINFQNNTSGIGNAVDTTDDTVYTYTLPANALNANGKGIKVRASCNTAGNGNNKTFKIWFAGATVSTSGVIASNGQAAVIEADITRISATAITATGVFIVNAVAPVVTTTTTTAVSDLAANTSEIKTTAASPTTGAARDGVCYWMKVIAEN